MAHLLEEFFIARHGQLALGGMDEARAFAPGRITVEREVGDDECRIAQLDGAAVQLAVLVLKNAQVGAFFGQLGHNGAVVGIAHAQQDDKARPDGPGSPPLTVTLARVTRWMTARIGSCSFSKSAAL